MAESDMTFETNIPTYDEGSKPTSLTEQKVFTNKINDLDFHANNCVDAKLYKFLSIFRIETMMQLD